jgi:hypothetical protein
LAEVFLGAYRVVASFFANFQADEPRQVSSLESSGTF